VTKRHIIAVDWIGRKRSGSPALGGEGLEAR
jgi:hypothetical protein